MLRDRNRARVRRVNRGAIDRRFDLCEYPVLEREVLEHRLDDEIGRLEPRVVRRSADEAHVVVELLSRDLPAREALLSTPRMDASPFPMRAVSVSLRRTNVPCCTAIDAMPAPMNPAPSTPSL